MVRRDACPDIQPITRGICGVLYRTLWGLQSRHVTSLEGPDARLQIKYQLPQIFRTIFFLRSRQSLSSSKTFER